MPTANNLLDSFGQYHCYTRMTWIKEPNIHPAHYIYDPTYIEDSDILGFFHLLYNYIETDSGLRKRIKASIK